MAGPLSAFAMPMRISLPVTPSSAKAGNPAAPASKAIVAAAMSRRRVSCSFVNINASFFPWVRSQLLLRRGLLDQLHVPARHQPLDVQQDQHAVIHRAQARDEARLQGRAELRRRLDLL